MEWQRDVIRKGRRDLKEERLDLLWLPLKTEEWGSKLRDAGCLFIGVLPARKQPNNCKEIKFPNSLNEQENALSPAML